jgi:hypothetical protein
MEQASGNAPEPFFPFEERFNHILAPMELHRHEGDPRMLDEDMPSMTENSPQAPVVPMKPRHGSLFGVADYVRRFETGVLIRGIIYTYT